MHLLLYCLVGLAVLLAFLVPDRPPDHPVRRRAVSEMLDAVQFDRIVRAVWNENATPQIGYRQSMQLMVAQVTKDEILRRFTPLFAAYVDLALARKVRAAPDGRAARKLFDKTKPRYREVDVLIYPQPLLVAVEALIDQWADEFHDKLCAGAELDNRAAIAAMCLDAAGGRDPAPPCLQVCGVDYIDAISDVMLSTGHRAALAAARLYRHYEATELAAIIDAQCLMRDEVFRDGRQALAGAQQALAHYIQDFQAILRDAIERYRKIDALAARLGGEKILEQIVAPLALETAKLAHFEKINRTVLTLIRRILLLTETQERGGLMVMDEDQLFFKDDASWHLYLRLRSQFDVALEDLCKHMPRHARFGDGAVANFAFWPASAIRTKAEHFFYWNFET